MTKDQQYYLNRKFVFKDILKCLFEKEYIDSESVAYFPEQYNFTCEDYIETWNYLTSFDNREDKSSNIKDMTWPEERSYFQIDNFRFILGVVSGQGSYFYFTVPSNNCMFDERFEVELFMDYLGLEFPNWIQQKIKANEDMRVAMQEYLKSEAGQKLINFMKD